MRPPSPIWRAAGFVVAAVFVTRAATGALAVRSYDEGVALADTGAYAAAIPRLDAGLAGTNRPKGFWVAGQVRLELWDAMTSKDEGPPGADAMLGGAAAVFLRGRGQAPASSEFTAALSEVYARREQVFRDTHPADLAHLDRGPWAFLGDDGRVAIGLLRAAIDHQPTTFEFRDQLVLLLVENDLPLAADRAMEESARVLPDFGAHPDFSFDELPRGLVETFWRVSRAMRPGEAPLLFRERHLLSLGQLGRRLGHLQEAEEDLREALKTPGTHLFHAEDAYHLALVLLDQHRSAEAEEMLSQAVTEPVFRSGVAWARSGIAAEQGRWDVALSCLREARNLQPRDLGVLLRFAEVAEKTAAWDQAEEALRWAAVVHPEDPAPLASTVELYLAKGEPNRARSALDALVSRFGTSDRTTTLDRAVSAALDPRGRSPYPEQSEHP